MKWGEAMAHFLHDLLAQEGAEDDSALASLPTTNPLPGPLL